MATIYNVTFPHTSPQIEYDPTDNWYAHCPFEADLQICGGSTQPDGYHFTNTSGSTFKFSFWGKSIYIYGDADNGTSIQLSVNNVNSTRLPANGLLVAVDDITKICPASGNCATDVSNVPLGNATENVAVVTVKSQTAGAKVTLSKVMFGYPTHRSGVTASIKSYNSSDSQIQYSQGWSQNGTYLSSNSQISDTFTFPFDGQAVWVWGFCGPRQMSTDYYGKWTINNRYIGGISSTGDLSDERVHPPQDENCLIWFTANLPDTGNSLYYESDSAEINIKSIDILQVSGAPAPSSTQTTPSGKASTNVGAIAGGVVGGVAVIGLVAAAIFLYRRNQQRRKPPSPTPFVEGSEEDHQEQPAEAAPRDMSQTPAATVAATSSSNLRSVITTSNSPPTREAPPTTTVPPPNQPVPSEPPPPYA